MLQPATRRPASGTSKAGLQSRSHHLQHHAILVGCVAVTVSILMQAAWLHSELLCCVLSRRMALHSRLMLWHHKLRVSLAQPHQVVLNFRMQQFSYCQLDLR